MCKETNLFVYKWWQCLADMLLNAKESYDGSLATIWIFSDNFSPTTAQQQPRINSYQKSINQS